MTKLNKGIKAVFTYAGQQKVAGSTKVENALSWSVTRCQRLLGMQVQVPRWRRRVRSAGAQRPLMDDTSFVMQRRASIMADPALCAAAACAINDYWAR